MEKQYAELCLQVGSRRVACHHCGNVRKDFLQCSDCPQVFCRNCAEKVVAEHGVDVFTQGCPVCKNLCCCAAKSVNCNHLNHCYRKCPASKARVASGNKNLAKVPYAPTLKSCASLDLLAAACEKANITHNRHEEIQQSKRSYSMMEQNNEVMSELSCSTSSSSSSENGSLSSSKKQKMNDGSAMMATATPLQVNAVKSSDHEHRPVVATMPQAPHAATATSFSSSSSMMPMTASIFWVYMPVPVSMTPVLMTANCGQQVMYRLPSSYYFTPSGHIRQERHLQYQQARLLQAQQAYAEPLPLPLPLPQVSQKYPDWLLRPSYPIGALCINQQCSEEVNVGGINSEQF